MVAGGKREGAGRKSSWNGPTKMIRLPAKYEAEIIEYAKRLDSDSKSPEVDLQSHINAVLLTIPPRQRAEAAKLFKKLTDRLNQP